MSRFAIVNPKTNRVVNVIIWEGASFLPPHGHLVVKDEVVNVDDLYNPDTNTFTRFYEVPGYIAPE